MIAVRTSSLTALALLSSVGLLSQVAAAPIDGSPAYGLPDNRASSVTAASPVKTAAGPAQPTGTSAEPPQIAASPAPSRAVEPASAPPAPSSDGSKHDASDGASPGWSAPGGSANIEEYQGIRYVSGGVGEGERGELNALSNQFNLRLMFAKQDGDYLSEVQVKALNASGGTILSAKSKGPLFFAQLPPGTYTIEASIPDQPQRQTARIEGSRQTQLNFYWR